VIVLVLGDLEYGLNSGPKRLLPGTLKILLHAEYQLVGTGPRTRYPWCDVKILATTIGICLAVVLQ
jgi:hypothetical protein